MQPNTPYLELAGVWTCPHCGCSEAGTVTIRYEHLASIEQFLRVKLSPATPPDRPPTGPGSPIAARGKPTRAHTSHKAPAVLHLTPETSARRAAAQARATRAHTPPHTPPYSRESAEPKVRAVWRPGMSVTQLERAAGVARSTAHKWRRVLESEHLAAQGVTQGVTQGKAAL